MKIVPKFAGGGISSLFTVYQSVPYPQIPPQGRSVNDQRDSVTVKDSSKQSKSEEEKGKLTEKDLFNMIKDIDGLPNEMKIIIKNLQNTLDTQNLLGTSTNELTNNYLNVLYKLKVANQNKTKFDESVKTSKENGSLGEVAITLSGNLMATDKNGGIKEITLEQYQQDPEQYSLLTNSNLAWLRKYSPRAAFSQSDEAFEIISNGVGFESFQKLLDTAKTNLGNYKYQETGVIEKEALAGLKALQGKTDEEKKKIIASITGSTVEYTTVSDSNVENIKTLISYLGAVLPKRVRVWAALKTGKPENEAVTTLVGAYLSSGIKQDNTLTFDLPGSKSGKGSSGESSDLDKIELNTAQRFLNGLGAQDNFILNPGTNRSMQVFVNTMPITNAEGKPIGANATMQDAVSGEYNGIFDTAHASMGGYTLNPSMFGGIILKDGKISSIDYPCIIKPNGEIIPNTSPQVIKAKQEAEKLLKSKGVDVKKPEDIKKYWRAINVAYKQFGLQDAYNEHGEPVGNWRRFGVINVTTSDKILGMDDMDDNPLLNEVTNDSTINNLIQITKDSEFNKKGFFNSITGSYNRFYEGTLWIPLNVNYHAATTSKMKIEEARALEEAQQARDVRAGWNTPPSI